ncbi:hypothetical protein OPT61_g2048 [Boeremia exigua]|uniref:Uncharacterized protein n=1 Tax=Boeremia exigua TaxID=749465 RepID=A0ACC2IN42_9PLEO|nr:hypothetical protein OPT61_g2048 [Boeremia exigua]
MALRPSRVRLLSSAPKLTVANQSQALGCIVREIRSSQKSFPAELMAIQRKSFAVELLAMEQKSFAAELKTVQQKISSDIDDMNSTITIIQADVKMLNSLAKAEMLATAQQDYVNICIMTCVTSIALVLFGTVTFFHA